MSTVVVRDLHKRFGRTQALRGISFTAGPGVTALLGRNGAGKTTLVRVLATVLSPDSGHVRLLGLDPGAADERVQVRRRLGYLPQEPGLHRAFTAFELVDYVAVLKELTDRRARHDEVRRVLGVVGLGGDGHRRVRALSGGQRRRLGIALALLGEPALVVLDEPTAGLDPEQRLRFRDLLSRVAEDRTVLVATHQTEDVAALARSVVVVDAGLSRFAGTPAGLAATAEGRVWTAQDRQPGAEVAWRTGTGQVRNLGTPPAGAALVRPTLEDAYLLLLGPGPAGSDGRRTAGGRAGGEVA